MDYRKLPVYDQRSRILDALQDHQVIVVESPTGSGKTTQLPVILHEAGYTKRGMVGVTQPRRIAAVTVSEFIRNQLQPKDPDFIAYKMRFEDHTTPATHLKIMTDGTLLQEIKNDTTLQQYSVIVVDEAHERSLTIDFILGLLKRVLEERPEFRVIISSATINAEIFSEYFNKCPVIRIETRTYPVQTIYNPPPTEEGYDGIITRIADVVGRIVENKETGDILIFASGEKLIKDTIRQLELMPYRRKLQIMPLYGRLSKEEQESVFPPAPKNKIKVVIATNIAETSVTIHGITSVIDTGLSKTNYYNPRTFTSSLVEGAISRASANQRKGRAGRTQPGTCYRLYSRDDFEARPLFTKEEIYRTDLSEVVLRMAEIGIRNFEGFDFISPPGQQGIVGAINTLRDLQALEDDHSLSKIGKLMARFPLLPRHSRIVIAAINDYPDVMDEVLIGTSFLTCSNPFLLPAGEEVAARKAHHRFQDKRGDFLSYIRLFQGYLSAKDRIAFCEKNYLDPEVMAEIRNVKDQLGEIVSEIGVPLVGGGKPEDYLCAISAGLIQFVCVRDGKNQYRNLTTDRIQIHPGSIMFRSTPRFIVAGEIVRTTRMWARSVSPLEPDLIRAIQPKLLGQLQDLEKGRKPKPVSTQNEVVIKGHTFPVRKQKGAKNIVELPWHELAAILQKRPDKLPPELANRKASIIFRDMELFSREKISTILTHARFFDLEKDIVSAWPGRKQYTIVNGQYPEIADQIHLVLKITRTKKGSKNLGFITLKTNGNGQYWFTVQRFYFSAIGESLATLEVLLDELPEDTDPKAIKSVNKAYRRLLSMYET
ncbi:MAG: helicase-related protein [Spirochaeta sp.]